MVVLMAAAYFLNTIAHNLQRSFWVEAVGIVMFGIYWLVKSWELEKTAAETKAIHSQLSHFAGKVRDETK